MAGLLVRCQWRSVDGWGEVAGTRGWPRDQLHDRRNQAHANSSLRTCDNFLTLLAYDQLHLWGFVFFAKRRRDRVQGSLVP